MPLLILPVLIILAVIALIPISIVQRYRVGTSRQRARSWLATLNIGGLSLSAFLFLVSAAFTNIWVPEALLYTISGLAAGWVLGRSDQRWKSLTPSTPGLCQTWLPVSLSRAKTPPA